MGVGRGSFGGGGAATARVGGGEPRHGRGREARSAEVGRPPPPWAGEGRVSHPVLG
jgi:hypothetical protein